MAKIAAIDVGLADTAIVVFEDGRFTDAHTITTKADGRRPTFPAVFKRGQEIARRVSRFLAKVPAIKTVAIEGYEDYGGGVHKRARSGALIPNRWTTPAVGVLIGDQVERDGLSVEWQPPGVVLTAYHEHKARWRAGAVGLVPGDELLTNDHLRSAACHALWYHDRHPEETS